MNDDKDLFPNENNNQDENEVKNDLPLGETSNDFSQQSNDEMFLKNEDSDVFKSKSTQDNYTVNFEMPKNPNPEPNYNNNQDVNNNYNNQQPYFNNQGYNSNNGYPNNQQNPQQTQWTYGTNNYNYNAPKPPKKKKDKNNKDKSVKKQKSPNSGIKVFAIIMSILFVLSTTTFIGYFVWNTVNDQPPITSDDTSKQDGTKLDINNTPDGEDVEMPNGALTNSQINKKVAPSVVGIACYVKSTGFQLLGQGSGVIMSKDGYIVTNAHVVTDTKSNREIAKIEVILSDGKTYEAKKVGADIETDLAVIKINADNLPVAEFGDSSKLEIGDRVVVIGNPDGLKYAGSQTHGFVSALNRAVYMNELGTTMEYIQTDAPINPGNSGGAFINEYGQVVGISSAKLVAEGFEGMGFAIPINNAKPVIDSLISNGYVSGRVKVGILFTPISDVEAQLYSIPKGLRVQEIQKDSDLFNSKLKVGDIITKMDGQDVYDTTTIDKVLDGKKPGDVIKITAFHVDENTGKGSFFEVDVKLKEKKPAQ